MWGRADLDPASPPRSASALQAVARWGSTNCLAVMFAHYPHRLRTAQSVRQEILDNIDITCQSLTKYLISETRILYLLKLETRILSR